MIKGIGIDIVEVIRFSKILKRRGQPLLTRVFTPQELESCGTIAYRLAGRFAAKEAFFKALGTGFRGFKWQEVEVKNNPLGAPYFHFSEKLVAYLDSIGVTKTHLTISHCKEYAVAQVIMEGKQE
ncbi:MAG TPA: holo-[acyl-carrier-protein] synthase [Firmicutes bacterium]|jgi:holo-[acyl-carrier protein] synthase|nr:holo-[acyl-carrier-protein] synthase [Bacillota bacterium]HBK68716.1 holo-[acyl-carrier-protein] synthase [Bacillota bacterium]HBT18282.1 holo-[acyl-carrier-protein] synthase [Bacillota bacterium]